MKKVILSVLGLTLLAACSGYDYYKTDVRYRQEGNDCVYYYGEKVEGAMAATFKYSGDGYGEDTFDAYYRGKKIK